MSCPQLQGAAPRISARRGQVVDLNVEFFHNGIPTDPYTIRHVEIYRTQVVPHNLVATIPISDPLDPLYPAPLCRDYEDTTGLDVTAGVGAIAKAGLFHLPYVVPSEALVPDVYFDVWFYYADNPLLAGTTPTADDLDDPQVELKLLRCCHRFWIYPEEWFCDDRLQTIKFGFEPLDQRFNVPEKRPLEVALMPLPLYDYNFNLVTPLIPFLRPTITITTQRCELLVDNDPCRIGLRQGSYRSNPWVVQYDLDTAKFLKGTYQYHITLTLPDGSTRVSRKFILVVA
jgi:hypothetical protein